MATVELHPHAEHRKSARDHLALHHHPRWNLERNVGKVPEIPDTEGNQLIHHLLGGGTGYTDHRHIRRRILQTGGYIRNVKHLPAADLLADFARITVENRLDTKSVMGEVIVSEQS